MWVMTNDELYHHGIKGQRWGVRNYQDENGELTAEGRRRYGIGERIKNTMTYRDENGKLHLTTAGKVTAGVAAGVTAAGVVTGVVLGRKYVNNIMARKVLRQRISDINANKQQESDLVRRLLNNKIANKTAFKNVASKTELGNRDRMDAWNDLMSADKAWKNAALNRQRMDFKTDNLNKEIEFLKKHPFATNNDVYIPTKSKWRLTISK